MWFPAGAMYYPELVDIFGREHKTGERMAGIDQSMKGVSLRRIDVKNARRFEVIGVFGNWHIEGACVIISLKEQVVVVQSAPMQQRIGGGAGRHCDNMQVVP